MRLCKQCRAPVTSQGLLCDPCESDARSPAQGRTQKSTSEVPSQLYHDADDQYEGFGHLESFDTIPNMRGPSDGVFLTPDPTLNQAPSTTSLLSPRQPAPIIKDVDVSYTEGARGGVGLGEGALEPIFDHTMSEDLSLSEDLDASDLFESLDGAENFMSFETSSATHVSHLGGFEQLKEHNSNLDSDQNFGLTHETEVSLLPSLTLETLTSPLPEAIEELDLNRVTNQNLKRRGPPPLSTKRTALGQRSREHSRFNLLFCGKHTPPSQVITPRESFSVDGVHLTWDPVSESQFTLQSADEPAHEAHLGHRSIPMIWSAISQPTPLRSPSLLRQGEWRFVIQIFDISDIRTPSRFNEPTLGRQDTQGYVTPRAVNAHHASESSQVSHRSNPFKSPYASPHHSTLEVEEPRSSHSLIVYRVQDDVDVLYGIFPLTNGVHSVGVGVGDISLPRNADGGQHALFSLVNQDHEVVLHPTLSDIWRALRSQEEVLFGTLLAVDRRIFSVLSV